MSQFHDGTITTISIAGRSIDSFPIAQGVKQSCVLSIIILTIFLATALRDMTSEGIAEE